MNKQLGETKIMKNETKEKRATFTPGPWASAWVGTKPHGSAVVWLGENTRKRIQVTGTGRDVANARLIAAAPELYEQCKLFERTITELMMQGETGGYEEHEKLREILAKVDGGEG
jgi:hypothetical protein